MHLYHLSLQWFKNYSAAQATFPEKITSLVGNNGAGKTNILDAVHYLSFCKSYFNAADSQNITHGNEQFSILGKFRSPSGNAPESVHCVVRKSQRKLFRVNGKEVDRLADHIGKIPSVMVSPYDHVLIDGGSEERRRYLDVVISQYDRTYLDDLIHYNRALMQRNALLRQMAAENRFSAALLEPWDEQMINPGTRIFETRSRFIEDFIPVFYSLYRQLAGDAEPSAITYVSQLQSAPVYRDILAGSLEKDRILRYSSAGVHKDDLTLSISGVNVKRFGSQGQQKSFILALKLAQFRFLHHALGIKPILLLDDVFDKLDRNRIERLMEMVNSDDFGQILITDTNASRIHTIFSGIAAQTDIIQIDNGNIARL
ncbi:MAG TPA: DNA replication and repair protein RecF [Bacteroidales bacterium]|nr:DNA replication and repair protein RecF [Bacteroidales bacterium]HRZ49400.1 DNA replication and repair protein RecF [Bacteroidales bacterium]